MTRFNNPVPILTELLNILNNTEKSKKFEGLKSKKSVHEISLIATGTPGIPDSGRLYFERKANGKVKIAIDLKDKKRQSDFVKRRFL